ncbi:hypothetical protein phiP47_024 [Plesiomonas phage phiP4-7]|nr:hypothetical protein phiP47_024 [Plesiomonas phage phiP4-7]
MKKLIIAAVALSALSAPVRAIDRDILAFCKGDEKCELVMKIYAYEQILRGKTEVACKYGNAKGKDVQFCKQLEMDNLVFKLEAEEAARIADDKYLSGAAK